MNRLLSAAVFVCMSIVLIPADVYSEEQNTIPSWIKQTAVFWGNGQISDAEFITALQYLIQVGILTVPAADAMQESDVVVRENTSTHSNVHPDAVQGTITRIIDGDTLVFDGDTYRLSLIDTPERGEDGYSEATNALKELCPSGSTAYMEADSIRGTDRYDRYLGAVWCEGNNYDTTAGEYLFDNGLLKKFYTGFCDDTEAATAQWAEESGNWFYHNICN